MAETAELVTIMQRARRIPLLSAADESRLARRIEAGDLDAKREMVEANLRLVVALARVYRTSEVAFADLIQEGTVGLVKAVERFDHRRGLKFSTYAVWWIRRSLLDAIGSAQVIRVPPRARQQMAALHRARAELERDGERTLPPRALAERAGLPETAVMALSGAARVTASLDEQLGEGAGSLADLVADERATDPAEWVTRREQRDEVVGLLRLLPAKHRHVLIRRYGLGGVAPQSHERIGATLGVGEERSRQIEREALNRLRSVAHRFSCAA